MARVAPWCCCCSSYATPSSFLFSSEPEKLCHPHLLQAPHSLMDNSSSGAVSVFAQSLQGKDLVQQGARNRKHRQVREQMAPFMEVQIGQPEDVLECNITWCNGFEQKCCRKDGGMKLQPSKPHAKLVIPVSDHDLRVVDALQHAPACAASVASSRTDSSNDFVQEVSSSGEDDLWLRMRTEARRDAEAEPVLASFLYSTILAHRSLDRALAFHLGNKLASNTLLSTHLVTLILDTFMEDAEIRNAVRADIKAVKERDPACVSYSHCMLNFKGFLACQAHRVAHRLWQQGRNFLALTLQSRVSEEFHVDIHPAARIGKGILFDHATGVVVGETAVIGNNVSILHNVTLGGTGALGGDRHPKLRDGVLVGAGSILLGPITVGEGAKIGAGSLVLSDVPPHTTAVGNPARLVRGKRGPERLQEIPSKTMDHTSFMEGWSDFVI